MCEIRAAAPGWVASYSYDCALRRGCAVVIRSSAVFATRPGGGMSQASSGEAHIAAAIPSPKGWRIPPRLRRKSVDGREQVSLSTAMSSRLICRIRSGTNVDRSYSFVVYLLSSSRRVPSRCHAAFVPVTLSILLSVRGLKGQPFIVIGCGSWKPLPYSAVTKGLLQPV